MKRSDRQVHFWSCIIIIVMLLLADKFNWMKLPMVIFVLVGIVAILSGLSLLGDRRR